MLTPLSIHAVVAPVRPENSRLWATVWLRTDDALGWHWQVTQGTDLGSQTHKCQFATLQCVQRYLAGTWGVPLREVCV
jgi:hypothetical protein